jgi:hypothetical protein
VTVLRHLVAILILPFTVTVVVPVSLMQASLAVPAIVEVSRVQLLIALALGLALTGASVLLFVLCVCLFARIRGRLPAVQGRRSAMAGAVPSLTRPGGWSHSVSNPFSVRLANQCDHRCRWGVLLAAAR